MTRGLTVSSRVPLRDVLDSGSLSTLSAGQLLERYVTCRDERAFELIVTRHAAMVLGVCRRVLRDPNDVEDAFQATFLILVRNAPTIRSRDRLSPWLYGVAYKVACRARSVASRRRSREGSDQLIDVPGKPGTEPGSDLVPLFDEEMTRLPENYRAAVLLCCLEGKSHDEAAGQLNWPVGTLRSRLHRGRHLLQARLRRRGVVPSFILGESLTKVVPQAAPASLIQLTVLAANATGVTSTSSASVAALTQGVLTTMFLTKLKVAAGVVLLTSALGSGAVLMAQNPEPKPQGESVKAVAVPTPRRPDRVDGSVPRDAGRPKQDVTDIAPPTRSHELVARLNLALALASVNERLNKRTPGIVSFEELEKTKLEADVIRAQIADEVDALKDSIAILKLQSERLAAEYELLHTAQYTQSKKFDLAKKLKDRQAIGDQEFLEAQGLVESARGQLLVKKVDIKEIDLRVSQLERRLKQFSTAEIADSQPAPEAGRKP